MGGAPGVLLASRAGEEAAAGCKKVGQKCDKGTDCCDEAQCKGGKKVKCRSKSGLTNCSGEKACIDLNDDSDHCGASGQACSAGERCCNGAFVDSESDRANCGNCGIVCGSVQICSASVCLLCQPSSPRCGNVCCAVESCCAGVCVDLQTGRVNRGTCFSICDFDEARFGGTCKVSPGV